MGRSGIYIRTCGRVKTSHEEERCERKEQADAEEAGRGPSLPLRRRGQQGQEKYSKPKEGGLDLEK